jgi:hypothetical protein
VTLLHKEAQVFSDNRQPPGFARADAPRTALARCLLLPCLVAGAILALGASPAGAHSDSYGGAEELCGPGYFVVDDPDGTPARRAVKTASGTVFGHVYLLYSNATGKNCVVTIKSRFHGTDTYVTAALGVRGRTGRCDGWFCDFGNFAHFAGGPPSYKTTIRAAGRCVRYWGQITSRRDAQGTLAEGGRRRWGNCGG